MADPALPDERTPIRSTATQRRGAGGARLLALGAFVLTAGLAWSASRHENRADNTFGEMKAMSPASSSTTAKAMASNSSSTSLSLSVALNESASMRLHAVATVSVLSPPSSSSHSRTVVLRYAPVETSDGSDDDDDRDGVATAAVRWTAEATLESESGWSTDVVL